MLAGKDGLRLSLAGAQDKLPVVFDGARIGLPLAGEPSSHILKPAIHSIQDSVINEGVCMALAETMQLKPAKSKVHQVLDRSFLLVERYDRLIDGQGYRQRLHQEDFCQALGVVPELKYQNKGGPDLVQCFDLVRRATRPNAPQKPSLTARCPQRIAAVASPRRVPRSAAGSSHPEDGRFPASCGTPDRRRHCCRRRVWCPRR